MKNKKRKLKETEKWDLLGELDELNSFIGFAKTFTAESSYQELLTQVQTQIFRVLTETAGHVSNSSLKKINLSDVYFLSKKRMEWKKRTGKIHNFVIPGGTQFSSCLHCLRTIARRVERTLKKYRSRKGLIDYLDCLACFFFDFALAADVIDKKIKFISSKGEAEK